MSELEQWRKKKLSQTISSEEGLEAVMKLAKVSDSPYRLELIYDKENKVVILQGDEAGLGYLLERIIPLAKPDTVSGMHEHFNTPSGFTYSDLNLIVQRVNSDETGSDKKSIG